MNKNNDSLKKKTISGLVWSFSDLMLNQGIQFIIQVVLARLLLPKEFGLIGMITIFIAVSNSIIDSGFTNALIREEEANQEDYSTVFYFNLMSSILIYIILYYISPYVSKFFNEQLLEYLLKTLGVVIIINSFGLIQRTILIRKLDFRTQTIINIISSITSGILAIYLAYKGFGVWSLVIRMIFMQMVQAILLCSINKWIPSLVFSIKSFKKLFGFGWKLLISGLIDTLYNNLYYLVIGKFYSASDLGYYTNAQKFRDVASTSISTAVQKVTYPVLSSMQSEDEKLKQSYRKIIKSSVYITFPVMIGLSIIGYSLIMLVFGSNWEKCIEYFQILCLAGMLYPLHALNLNILQVKGRSDLFLKLEVIKKIVAIVLIAIALSLKLGIIGLIWIVVLNSIIGFFINSHYSKEIIDYSTTDQIKDIIPILFATIVMAIFTWIIGYFIPNSYIIRIILQSFSGIIIYILISKILKLEQLNIIINLVKKIKV